MRVISVAAISLDGMIAHSPTKIIKTSPQDKRYFAEVTKKIGVVIVGRQTFSTFKAPLAGRRNIVYTTQEELLRVPATPEVEYTKEPPRTLLKRLAEEGVSEVANIGGSGIFSLFEAEGLVDEYHLTVSPQWVGSGVPLLKGIDPFSLKISRRELWETGETLLIGTLH